MKFDVLVVSLVSFLEVGALTGFLFGRLWYAGFDQITLQASWFGISNIIGNQIGGVRSISLTK